ncbi:MalM family protein [Vibrio astriarenae]
MLRQWFAIGALALSVGCSSVDSVLGTGSENIQASNAVASSLTDLRAYPLPKNENVIINIEKETQRLQAYGIDSPVAVYQLPDNSSVFKLTLRSYYGATVFAPSALVVDSHGNVLADIPNSEFSYKPATLLQTFRQEAQKRISVSEPTGPVYVILYTTDLDKRGKSSIWVRQETSSGTEEVKIQHAATGRVGVEFDALSQSDTVIISEDNGLELKTIDYTTSKVESLFDDLRNTIRAGDTEAALELVDKIQKL